MADNIGNTVNSILGSTQGVVSTIIIIIIGIIVTLVVVGGLFYYFWNKKRYNLTVEIKKTRFGNQILSRERALGLYNAKKGVLLIKRKGIRGTTPVKVFDIRKFLQGEDYIELLQLSPNDYTPILPESYCEHTVEYKDQKTGEIQLYKESTLNIKVDSGLNKAWKSSYENAAKRAYSLQSFISQFQVPISIAIVLIAVFAGFAMIWTRLGGICG